MILKNKGKNFVFMLAFTLVCVLFLFTVVGAENGCPYHQEHNETCGYIETIEGHECTHEHTDECYEKKLVCPLEEHIHNEECYDENNTLICLKEEHSHIDACYEKVLSCQHVHNNQCSYVEAVAGQECTHKCSYCDEVLERTAKINFSQDKNTITIASSLNNEKVEDSLFFHVRFHKDYIEQTDLVYDSSHHCYYVNGLVNGTSKTIVLESVEEGQDIYLRYQIDYGSTVSFDIHFDNIPGKMNVDVLTSSSYDMTDYQTLASIEISDSFQKDDNAKIQGEIVSQQETGLYSQENDEETNKITNNSDVNIQSNGLNMNEWSSGVTLIINNGNPVTPNTSVPIRLTFEVPDDVELKNGDILTYQISEDLAATFDFQTLINNHDNVYDIVKDGKIIAQATVNEEGLISVEIKDATTLRSNVTGYVAFSANVKKESVPGDGSSVDYKDGITIDYNDTVKLQKTEADFDPNTGEITYTIRIDCDGYITGPISFEDTMNDLLTYVKDSVSITSTDISLDNINYNDENHKLTFNITSNGDKIPAGSYYITYSAIINKENIENNAFIGVNNSVKIAYGDNLSKESSYTKWIKKVDLNKYGYADSDNQVQWVIDINQGLDSSQPWKNNTSIGGMVITDTLDANQRYNFPLTLISYDNNGNQSINKIQENDNHLKLYDIDGNTTENVEDAVKFEYTFPEGASGYYRFEYSTTINQSEDNVTSVTNKVSSKNDESEASVGISGSGSSTDVQIEKTVGDYVINPGEDTAIIPWTITFKVPENVSELQDYKITDTLTSNLRNSQGPLSTVNQRVDYSSFIIKVGEEVITEECLIKEISIDKTADWQPDAKFEIHFQNVLLKCSPGSTITITYNSEITLYSASDLSYSEYINTANDAEASIKQVYKKEYVQKPSDHVTYNANDNTLEWTIYVNATKDKENSNWVMRSDLSKGTQIHLEDSWDPHKMEYVEGSIKYYYSASNQYDAKEINDTSQYTTTYMNGNLFIDFSLGGEESANNGYLYIIKYKTKIVDNNFLLSHHKDFRFENTVKYENEEHVANKTVQHEFVKKSGNQVKENGHNQPYIDYCVYMNPSAASPEGIETFDAVDTLPKGTSILLDTIQLYKASYVNGEYQIIDGNAPIEGIKVSVSINENGQEVVNFSNLPVGETLALKYRISVLANQNSSGDTVTLTNSIQINGMGSDISTGNNVSFDFSDMVADIQGGTTYFTIQKASENDALGGLSGAVFELYEYNNDTSAFIEKESQTSTDDGKITFGKGDTSDTIKYNTVYYLQETQAPIGYEMNNTQYAFVILSNNYNLDDISGLEIENGNYYTMVNGQKVEVKLYTGNQVNMLFTVYNAISFSLPETGGTPLILTSVMGITMMSIGIIYFFKRKRAHRKAGES